MCDHAKRVMGRLQHRNAMLNKEVIELKAKLEIEAIRYDMQVKVSKTTSHLMAFSWIFFCCLRSYILGQLSWCRTFVLQTATMIQNGLCS
jgi:hypothetical protein